MYIIYSISLNKLLLSFIIFITFPSRAFISCIIVSCLPKTIQTKSDSDTNAKGPCFNELHDNASICEYVISLNLSADSNAIEYKLSFPSTNPFLKLSISIELFNSFSIK